MAFRVEMSRTTASAVLAASFSGLQLAVVRGDGSRKAATQLGRDESVRDAGFECRNGGGSCALRAPDGMARRDGRARAAEQNGPSQRRVRRRVSPRRSTSALDRGAGDVWRSSRRAEVSAVAGHQCVHRHRSHACISLFVVMIAGSTAVRLTSTITSGLREEPSRNPGWRGARVVQ